ncbi:MAG TPA: methyltransferase domain-containing protein [Candidatus Limnocylindrales bacterium]|nr:methyltransferase domain-containing protein [Candidatus Limnocylindrales bacterium]
MNHFEISPETEQAIKDATFPFIGWTAADLYRKVVDETSKMQEPGIDFGETALDIGSRDGRYVPVMRSLGLQSIMAIDPSAEEMQTGIDHGILDEDEAFVGTLQEYHKQVQPEPVDTVFVLNVNPLLPRDPEFIDAVMDSVKPGGVVVASFVERSTHIGWTAQTHWRHRLVVPPKVRNPDDFKKTISWNSESMSEGGSPHHFLDISIRTDS